MDSLNEYGIDFNKDLTTEVKKYCLNMGADLVGIAPPDRWKNAPIERSPLGLMPSAKSVVVCGFHYLDACVELSENEDVRIPGAANANHIASGHAIWMAYKFAKKLEKAGYKAIPIPVTLWWNYRESSSAARGFASDLTHYYAAVAAGLGEIGWSNICITPKYGPRLRFISIITDAPLDPDPMYSGDPLCDKCMLCAKKCPIGCFDKEVNGMLTVDYGERQFTFPNKNLWRCAAGENFNLDIYADWPETINEDVILDFGTKAAISDPSLRYGWKMGQCLKHCVPKHRRYYNKDYSPSPRRRRDAIPEENKKDINGIIEDANEFSERIGIDFLSFIDAESLNAKGFSLSEYMPGAGGVILVGQKHPKGVMGDSFRSCGRNALWLSKYLQEKYDVDVLLESGIDSFAVANSIDFDSGIFDYMYAAVITNLKIPTTEKKVFYEINESKSENSLALTNEIKEIAEKSGAELFGITPVSRLDEIDNQLEKIYSEDDYFYAKELGWGEKSSHYHELRGRPTNPSIEDYKLIPKRAKDYVEDAKSVIVVGLSLIKGSIENAGKPPAKKAGHYSVSTSQESIMQNAETALKIANSLLQKGYKVAITDDLEQMAFPLASTMQPNLQSNRFPAVAAGLGELGKNGLVLTPEFGSKVRFVSIITDAELSYNEMYSGDKICLECGKCATKCPVGAISKTEEKEIVVEGKSIRFGTVDIQRCEWASRYALVGEEGPNLMGSNNDFTPPEVITKEILEETLKSADRIQTQEYCPIVEKCFTECPL